MSDRSQSRPAWHYAVPVGINFVSVLLSFLSRIALARILGPSAFGTFAIWENNVQLFGTLGTSGETNHAIREIARPGRGSKDDRRTAVEALCRTLVAATIFGLAGALIFYLFQDGSGEAAAMQVVAVIAFALLLTLSALHRSLGSMIVGMLFNRLFYQTAFLILLIAAAGLFASAYFALSVYTGLLAAAAAASIVYLLRRIGLPGLTLAVVKSAVRNARQVVPFFFVNSLFVINARYILAMSGIFLTGDLLGQVGLMFTVVAMMIIPISTLNLVYSPILARRLHEPGARKVIGLYLAAVAMLSLGGVFVVYLLHPLIFMLADIARTVPSGLILLLCAAFGLTLLGNAVLIVEQLSGRAASAARLFAVVVAAKLAGGFVAGQMFGIAGLLWTDVALGSVMLAALLVRTTLLAPKPN